MAKCKVLAIQKKVYPTPTENLKAVRDILERALAGQNIDPYSGDRQHSGDQEHSADQEYSDDRSYSGDQAYSEDQEYSGNRSYSGDQAYSGDRSYSGDQAYSGDQGYSSNQKGFSHISGNRPDFILLPEIFTCPYDNSCFPTFAQKDGGEVFQFLSGLAREYHCYLIGGSVPEIDEQGRIYNTSYVFDRCGSLIAKHRKVHLFDINVLGGQYFRESDVLTAGDSFTVFDTEYGKMGVCICFDIRFPDLFLKMRDMGVKMVFVPAAFNMTTGPAHWEILFRSRALDQQIFLLGCSPARDTEASYVAYGHSILTDPWGRAVKELDENEGLLSAEINFDMVDTVRRQIPLREW